jgi:hypothetical protein
MNHQGKRPNQVKFSEDAVFYGILGMLLVTLVSLLIKTLTHI